MSQGSTLSPVEEVVAFFSRGPSREEIATFHLSDGAQNRLRDLLHKNSIGAVTEEENRELDQMVLLDDIIALIRARVQGSAHLSAGSAGA